MRPGADPQVLKGERPGESDARSPKTAQPVEGIRPGSLCCTRCGRSITDEAARIEVGGSHTHTRMNPGGFVYRFGCFSCAPGCRAIGEPSGEYPWFSGHTWQLAVCSGCAAHLGWLFSGEASFFGLVLERLSAAQ